MCDMPYGRTRSGDPLEDKGKMGRTSHLPQRLTAYGSQLADERTPIDIGVGASDDHDDVNDPPDAAAAQRDELEDTEHDIPGIEAVNTVGSNHNSKNECDGPVIALVCSAGLRLQ